MTQSEAVQMLAEWLEPNRHIWKESAKGNSEARIAIMEARRRYLDMVGANVAAIVSTINDYDRGTVSDDKVSYWATEQAHTTIQSLHDGAREAGKP